MMFRRASFIAEKINPTLFKAFLLLGFLTGAFIGSLSVSVASSPPSLGAQENFLFALVENAQDENSPLLALWLAATFLENGEVSWMPIYPIPLKEGNSSFAAAHDPIWVSPQDLEFWQTLDLLSEQVMWWDEIIVLDRVALASLANLIQSETLNHPVSTWAEPQTALYQEVTIIQQVCDQSAAFNNTLALDQLLLLSAERAHLNTTFTSFEFIAIWDKFSSGQFELSCNHPWAD